MNSKEALKIALRKLGFEVRRSAENAQVGVPKDVGNSAVNRLRLDVWSGSAWPKRPIAFVLVSSNHGTFIVNRNDYQMIDETNGFGLGFQILNSSCYDYPETKLLLALLSNRREFYGDGVVAVDCGANCGIHTVEWSRHMFGWGNVIAIEAQEKIYYALCGNIAINNCLNAKAILAAVGGEAKEILVPCPDYLKPASFGSLEIRKRLSNEFIGEQINYIDKACVKLPQVTIDALNLDRVDVLKVDVEGMEVEVIAGAKETIMRHMPQMYIEVLKSDVEVIKTTLKTLGYKHFDFGENLLAVHENDNAAANISMRDGVLRVQKRPDKSENIHEESFCPK